MSLTTKRTAKLLRQGKPGRYIDAGATGVRGLYLVVIGKGSASWQLRYQLHDRPHWMGLGSARDIGLAKARELARQAREKLASKIDPLVARNADRAAQAASIVPLMTFRETAVAFIEAHRAEWKSVSHGKQWLTTLEQYCYPIIGRLDVGAINLRHVLQVLDQPVKAHRDLPAGKFWTCRTTTADRVRSRMELVLGYAAARGHRSKTEPNPAAWDNLREVLPAPTKITSKVHHAAVSYAEVPQVMHDLRKHAGISTMALQFLVLTAARAGELLGAQWSEIDFDAKTWIVPATRVKNNKEHRVPLSPQALEILKSLPHKPGNENLFIGAQAAALSHNALAMMLKRIGRRETLHGFRSSFSDWGHERTGFSDHAIELSLAHSVGSDVEKAYRRGDMIEKRKQLMAEWGKFCTSPPVRKTGEVIPMGKAKA